jgi:hypothetical protein
MIKENEALSCKRFVLSKDMYHSRSGKSKFPCNEGEIEGVVKDD